MDWYYAKGQQQLGPVDDAELRRLAQSGSLHPADLVWNAEMGDKWEPASAVPGLFAPAAGQVPVVTVIQPPPPPPGMATAIGTTHNRDLMRLARESLRGRWGTAIGVTAVYWGMFMGVSSLVPIIGSLACLVLAGPLFLGYSIVLLALARRTTTDIGRIFDGFKTFGPALGAYLLVALFTFLWTLLFVIPGIIATLAYAMTFFIMADEPGVGPLEAIQRSKQMMRGYKWKLFCLWWRFFGWSLLCLFTCGIGYLWLTPYMLTTLAHFHDDIRPRA